MVDEIRLEMDELRAVVAYAAENAVDVLELFERLYPSDRRPREAIESARMFARGGACVKTLRDAAWAALRAAKQAESEVASHAARAAMCAPSAAFLHPLARATQVKHILGAAAHAARAAELAAGDGSAVAADHLARAARRATPEVVAVLRRYPLAPSGGGRVGELMRSLDRTLRDTTP